MSYTRIQFIAYCIYVGGKQKAKSLQQYYPGLPNLDLDIERRCDLMGKAVTQARSSAGANSWLDKGAQTLKIFVAPEFFFRGPTGGYSLDQYQKVLSKLQAFANKPEYKDWLFVFGSTVAASNVDQAQKEVYNIVVVQKGNSGEDGCRIIMKEHKSVKDFLVKPASDGGLDDREVAHLPAAKASGVGRERQKHNYGGEGIFDIDDICYGVEICYDHLEQRLRKSAIARGEARVQVQIVPSAGASIATKSVITVENGLVFNCDGLYSQGAGFKPAGIVGHSQLCVTKKACSGKTDATLEDISPLGYIEVKPSLVADGIFFKGSGQLHFYPAQPIPKPSTRSKLKFWKDYK
jgi:predicted amidohydrolase